MIDPKTFEEVQKMIVDAGDDCRKLALENADLRGENAALKSLVEYYKSKEKQQREQDDWKENNNICSGVLTVLKGGKYAKGR